MNNLLNYSYKQLPVKTGGTFTNIYDSINNNAYLLDKVKRRHFTMQNRQLGKKEYELTNHLGNVLAVITDRKIQVQNPNNTSLVDYFLPDVVSVSDYYSFGSELPNRTSSVTNYRFGFQDQEKDAEIFGEGNTYSFKYRVYDSRLGKFFSIDPFTAGFLWNSPYSFSENRVIDAIELEGGEKLKVAVNSEPTPDKSGSAKITITLDYMVVTSGRGAVSKPIDPTLFQKAFARGNGKYYMAKLPTSTSEGVFLNRAYERWARKAEAGSIKHQQKLKKFGIQYYVVHVEYNYSITDGTTLSEAEAWLKEDEQGRGIIMEPIQSADYKSDDDSRLIQSNIDAKNEFFDPACGGYGQNESYAKWDYNLIILNPNNAMQLSPTEIAVHESGHNSAMVNVHSLDYNYDQEGLQSNKRGMIYPNK